MNRQKNTGFTLIETMVAVFILTISLTAFFGVVASSLFSARYANNEITATYLLQEAADSIRNDRDSLEQAEPSTAWAALIAKYSSCASADGCQVEPTLGTISSCTGAVSGGFGTIKCPVFNYDPDATHHDFYTYDATLGTPSRFKRRVRIVLNPNPDMSGDEIDVIVTAEWQNGNLTRSQTLVTSLLNWRKNL